MKDYLPVVVHLDERSGLVVAISVYSVGGDYAEPVLIPRDAAAKVAGCLVEAEVERLLKHQT